MKAWFSIVSCLLAGVLGMSEARADKLPVPADSPTLAAIVARGELRVGLEAGYMPFEMRDRTGEIIGFDVDMAKLMARELGVKVHLVNTQWDGIIPALLTEKFDILMSGMTITAERAEQVQFSDPYIIIGQSLLINPKLKDQIHSYQDLDDSKWRIATKLGTSGELAAAKFMPKATIHKFETEADAVMDVRSGRSDAFVYDFPYNAVYVAQNPGQVIHLPTPFTHEPLGFGMRKDDPAMVGWVNQFLARAKADGAYQALYGKWFERSAWLKLLN